MAAGKFRAQGGVIADLRDFVFEGVKFNVLSFIVIATGKGFDEPDFAERKDLAASTFGHRVGAGLRFDWLHLALEDCLSHFHPVPRLACRLLFGVQMIDYLVVTLCPFARAWLARFVEGCGRVWFGRSP